MSPDGPGAASRRAFLGGAAGVAGLAAAGAGGFGIARATAPGEPVSHTVPFYGPHQAGIATPAQDRLAFAAFDVTTDDRDELRTLLARWAAAAAQFTAGAALGTPDTAPHDRPDDTGEALGLSAADLTITVGFGPTLFDDRFGLARYRPAALEPLPALPGDALEDQRSGGDLGVQACADDPQVAFHAIRNFARLARGTAVMRWSQLGFGRTSSTSTAQATPRNLMGFKDGTRNIKAESTAELDRFVWVGQETDQRWMRGGSYLVARRIRMLIESWDTDALDDQEKIFGRVRTSGAPLTGQHEFDAPDLAAHRAGAPVIDPNAHIRLAAPENNGGQKVLRRGYSYTDGIDRRTGLLDAGLFFLAYQQDPRRQFVPIQRRLGQHDLLNEYIRHTGSALFAVPPGLRAAGDYYGKALLGWPADRLSGVVDQRRVVVLGSTGSIGTQALDVIRHAPDRFRVVALAAGGSDLGLLAAQAAEWKVPVVGVGRPEAARELSERLQALVPDTLPRIVTGDELPSLAALDADVVLNAIAGAAGLRATLAALDAGRTVALANKESLVAGGPLVTSRTRPGQIRPVDSEHSALAQCLQGGAADEVRRLVVTASGGPFRGRSRDSLADVTPAQALAHPTWNMGTLITTNSATLVNKGLEVIEAHLLFGVPYERIDVVVHPQSVVHSMVEFTDGSTLAQLSPPDMRLTISLALGWPDRVPDAAAGMDWTRVQDLHFEPLDDAAFPAVRLARRAGAAGGCAPAVYNAANEALVTAFHAGTVGFLQIVDTLADVLDEWLSVHHSAAGNPGTVEDVEQADAWARARATELAAGA